MSYYTEEQIRKARTIDLLQVYEPTELIHVENKKVSDANIFVNR